MGTLALPSRSRFALCQAHDRRYFCRPLCRAGLGRPTMRSLRRCKVDRPKATRTLGVVLYPRFELLDVYGPVEMFGSLGHTA